MPLYKRLIYIALGALLFLVIGYFIYTGVVI